MIILGIESSCDETALSIIETRDIKGFFECRIISSLIHSQANLHSQYGGVYPNLAKREHSKNLFPLLKKILGDYRSESAQVEKQISDTDFVIKFSKISEQLKGKNDDLLASIDDYHFLKNIPNIDKIAVTEGPGLEPALWVGINFGLLLSELWSKPLIPVNHMEGHIVGSLLPASYDPSEWISLKIPLFPAIALLISGGHTELVKVDNGSSSTFKLKYEIIGQTKDDAVGEAFDKTARLLDLPYPGGPYISKLADKAREEKVVPEFKLPRPMIHSGDLDFSFSGLKTAVLYAIRDYQAKNGSLDIKFKEMLSFEFENAVKETLDSKLEKAIDVIGAKSIIVGGGVIANTTLRKSFEDMAKKKGLNIYLPSKHISGDNALMIALAGSLYEGGNDRKLYAQGTKRLG